MSRTLRRNIKIAVIATAMFAILGSLTACSNRLSALNGKHISDSVSKKETVTRTEVADYWYEKADNTGSVRTDDGNVWLINNPTIRTNGTVTVGFNDNGTDTIDDDTIVSIKANN